MTQNLLRGVLAATLMLISSCTRENIAIDPKNDFIPKMIEVPKVKKRIQQLPSCPKEWRKRISVNIGTGMSIKEFLRHAAIECGVSLNLDQAPDLMGISYIAKNSEFITVLKNLCRMAGWRVKINPSGDISILKDTCYVHTHEVAFMCNLTRIKTSTNLKNFSKDERGHIGDLSSETQLNLWDELEKNLKFLLKEKESGYSLNRQGGLLIVNATQAEHENIARFIRNLKRRVSSQIFAECRIVKVTLNKGFENGIEWDFLNTARLAMANPTDQIKVIDSISSGVNLIKHFGEVKTLSNPSTMMLNNQPAIFKVTSNQVYFKVKAYDQIDEVERNSKNSIKNLVFRQPVIDTTPEVIPVGIQMYLQPSINFANDTVSMHMKIIVSSADETKAAVDPSVSIMRGSVESKFPVIDENSIDTCIDLEDGQTVMFGGLMSTHQLPTRLGLRGSKFIAAAKSLKNEELVMLLKVNIIHPPREVPKDLSSWEIEEL